MSDAPTPIRFPSDLLAQIEEVADRNGSNLSVAVRLLVTEALNQRKANPMPLPTSDTLVEWVENSRRYRFLPLAGGGDDLDRVVCRTCSTRSSVVAVPTAELADHETMHDAEARA